MATGLIGTSTATSESQSLVTGSTLTYTCPASGVRYAIVSVSASCSVCSTATNLSYATAGNLAVSSISGSGSPAPNSHNLSYSVVLAPGQTWSGNTTARGGPSGEAAYGRLQASALEIV